MDSDSCLDPEPAVSVPDWVPVVLIRLPRWESCFLERLGIFWIGRNFIYLTLHLVLPKDFAIWFSDFHYRIRFKPHLLSPFKFPFPFRPLNLASIHSALSLRLLPYFLFYPKPLKGLIPDLLFSPYLELLDSQTKHEHGFFFFLSCKNHQIPHSTQWTLHLGFPTVANICARRLYFLRLQTYSACKQETITAAWSASV